MRLLLSTPIRFVQTPDGVLWARQVPDSYTFWERYLAVFDELTLLGRASQADAPPRGWLAATGPGVRAVAVPDYVGPYQLAARFGAVRRVIRGAARSAEAVLMRVPCHVGSLLNWHLGHSRPFGLEVTADPWDLCAPGITGDPLRPLWRRLLTRDLQRLCQQSPATAYVTREALQRRYPPPVGALNTYYSDALTTNYSSVSLPAGRMVPQPRQYFSGPRCLRLITVGSMDRLLKAQDVLLEAMALCVGRGLDLELTLAGDGRKRPFLEDLAGRLGLAGRVRFLGQVSSRATLQDELDRSDLFVLPSRSEALPRAIIEAMARALPVIGSTAGGIPELIDPECLVTPGDASLLAARIQQFAESPELLRRHSALNLANAGEYLEEVLGARRRAFYRHLARETETWLARRAAATWRAAENSGSLGSGI
jgi:glycosyltransferase involved in cell wall biosynthesis